MRPIIGIAAHRADVRLGEIEASHHVVNASYIKAVRKAGGVPLLLPVVEPDDAPGLLDRVDGMVMTGGGDVDPANYGAELDPRTTSVDAERDARDIALCRTAVERDLPTLAICRGSQILNVSLGGTLHQHVDGHFDLDRHSEPVHAVKIGGSRLASWVGAEALDVNTLHHQAVATVGDGATIAAEAEDGTIEGIEVSDRIIGVQWHPELLRHRPEHLVVFEVLVRLAST